VDRQFDRGDRHWGRIWGRPVAVAGYVEDVPEVGSRGDEEQESCARLVLVFSDGSLV
jgi:hypothetical protein